MALAMAIGLWLAYRDAKRRGLDPESFLKAAELGLLGALVGARLYYVLFNLDYYTQFPRKIIAVWEGGLAIHGGIIGGLLVGGGYAWLRRLPVRDFLDVAAPSLVLGQAIGRWGNFFNEEAFGTPTALPWKLYISPPHRPLLYAQDDFFHPAFLVRVAVGPRRRSSFSCGCSAGASSVRRAVSSSRMSASIPSVASSPRRSAPTRS